MKARETSLINEISIGDKLRVLREERGLTLKEMSDATGHSFSYLSEIEKNSTQPSLETVKQLADFFGVQIKLLVTNHKSTGLSVKLSYARKIKNLSQKELALKAGVSSGLIAQIELGKANVSLKTVNKLAEALGVSACYLILDRQDVDGMLAAISPELREMLQDSKVHDIIGSLCTFKDSDLRLILRFIDMVKKPRF